MLKWIESSFTEKFLMAKCKVMAESGRNFQDLIPELVTGLVTGR